MTGPASVADGLGAALSPPDGLAAAESLGAVLGVGLGSPPDPLLPSGAIVGRPASPRASLTSLRRSAMGDSTASHAAVWIVGFSTNNQRMISATSPTSATSTALRNQGGRTASWRSVPSSVMGAPPSGRTYSWNGRVLGCHARTASAG